MRIYLSLEDNNMRERIYNILSNIILRSHNVVNAKANIITSKEFLYEIEIIAENLYVP